LRVTSFWRKCIKFETPRRKVENAKKLVNAPVVKWISRVSPEATPFGNTQTEGYVILVKVQQI